MAVLSDHHWSQRRVGIIEMRRVARQRGVLFNFDPAEFSRYWFAVEYLPSFVGLIAPAYLEPGAWERELRMLLGQIRVERVPIPHDCADGFWGAYWRRPELLLDQTARDGISVFARVGPEATAEAVAKLKADLDSGVWRERHGDLLDRAELDLGYRLVTAEFG